MQKARAGRSRIAMVFFKNDGMPSPLAAIDLVICANRFQSNPPRHANADNIGPALQKIEQVRVKERSNNVLHHNDETYPFSQRIAAE